MGHRILALAACCWLAGCDQAGKFVIVDITDVRPMAFVQGRAMRCLVDGQVRNETENRLDLVSFVLRGSEKDGVAGLAFEIRGVNANHTIAPDKLLEIDTAEEGSPSCAQIADAIVHRTAGKVPIDDCSMPPVTEGRCQEMVVVTTVMKDADVRRIAGVEAQWLAQEKLREAEDRMPLLKALAALPRGTSDDHIADMVIRRDARSWAFNKYDPGSAHDTVETARAADGSSRTIHAAYSFNGSEGGWVNIVLYRDATELPLVEFFDFAGQWRKVRVPDEELPPPPPLPPPPEADMPAPAAAAPASAPEEAPADQPAADTSAEPH